MHYFRWNSMYLLELRILLSEFCKLNLSSILRRCLGLSSDLLPDIFRLLRLLLCQLLIVWITFHHAFNDILAIGAGQGQLITEADSWRNLFPQLHGNQGPSFAWRRDQAIRRWQLIHLNVKLRLSRRENAIQCII